ncbi:MAG: hypothetical protein JJU33_09895 [Phycisphaerales bacterium]|nr:hypothetical protein [Phycisphaerales bacterium]
MKRALGVVLLLIAGVLCQSCATPEPKGPRVLDERRLRSLRPQTMEMIFNGAEDRNRDGFVDRLDFTIILFARDGDIFAGVPARGDLYFRLFDPSAELIADWIVRADVLAKAESMFNGNIQYPLKLRVVREELEGDLPRFGIMVCEYIPAIEGDRKITQMTEVPLVR